MTITTYTNWLMISQMKDLGLFDNIIYKHIKNIINRNDSDEMEVEIEDLECDRNCWCKVQFTFELSIDVSGGCMPIMIDKKFVITKEYNGSSAYALMMLQLQDEIDDESYDESSDEEED